MIRTMFGIEDEIGRWSLLDTGVSVGIKMRESVPMMISELFKRDGFKGVVQGRRLVGFLGVSLTMHTHTHTQCE